MLYIFILDKLVLTLYYFIKKQIKAQVIYFSGFILLKHIYVFLLLFNIIRSL